MKEYIYDIEIFPNYFLIKFLGRGKKWITISSDSDYVKLLDELKAAINNMLLIGYNNKGYDRWILEYLLRNYKKLDKETLCLELKKLSDSIINEDLFDVVYNRYKLNKPSTNNLDISDWNNYISLKELGVRIHHPTLENLPFDPDTILNEEQKKVIEKYCENDVIITTKLLLNVLSKNYEAKQSLINSYNLPITYYSLSDRQIVENILCGEKAPRSPMRPDKKYQYKLPIDLTFETEELNDLIKTYEGNIFSHNINFKKKLDLFNLEIVFGLGGLHASKDNYSGENLIDIDVASYYPNILKNYDLLPNNVKNPKQYYNMIDERIENKKDNPQLATAQKIILNTVYGALRFYSGEKEGVLYDYKKLITTTITGQLLMVKLVEMLYLGGYEVVYVNTDGLMIKDKGDKGYLDICRKWEKEFSYTLEYNHIEKAFIRDVNNYMVLDSNGEIKTKGDYNLEIGTNNGAFHKIVWKAIKRYVFEGKDPKETIYESNDIRDFVLYHKYSKQYNVFLVNRKDNTRQELPNVVRYVLGNHTQENNITAIKDITSATNRYETNNVILVHNLNDFDLGPIDKNRYLELTYDKLEDLLGKAIVVNENIKQEVEKLKVSLNAK